jgi:phenylalanyl-tRNA synthetase beta chain
VNRLLGTQLTAGDIVDAVAAIGFECAEGPDGVDVVVPSWRYDTATETDVVEEVARHVGYSRLPRRRPMLPLTGSLTPRQADRRLVRSVLAGFGLAEAMPTPLLSPDDLRAAELDPTAVTITNPLAAEESVLRTSLRPGLLKAIGHNAAHRNPGVALFEVGTVFLPPADDAGPLPDEREHLAVVVAGSDATEAVRVLDVLAERLRVDALDLRPGTHAGLHPARSATVLVSGAAIGRAGELDPAVGERFGIAERVAVLELDLGALLDAPRASKGYRPVSRYPSSDVDLAFVTPDAQSARALAVTLAGTSPLVVDVRLFDVYRGDNVEPGHRSLAFRLRLQAPDRTLTDAEVATARQSAIEAVTAAHGATLRGG